MQRDGHLRHTHSSSRRARPWSNGRCAKCCWQARRPRSPPSDPDRPRSRSGGTPIQIEADPDRTVLDPDRPPIQIGGGPVRTGVRSRSSQRSRSTSIQIGAARYGPIPRKPLRRRSAARRLACSGWSGLSGVAVTRGELDRLVERESGDTSRSHVPPTHGHATVRRRPPRVRHGRGSAARAAVGVAVAKRKSKRRIQCFFARLR